MILSINISNSNNLNKFWVGIFTPQGTSIKFTKRQLVSESVSQSVSDKHKQWSDLGPIITKISYQLFGLRWTCILSKRQRRGTRRGLKCTGAWDFNFCCDAQSDLHVFAGRFFRRKDWLIAGICFGLVRWLFTKSYTCFIHDMWSPQVSGIYAYTIFAIQQERFLDDFDMPEEIDRTKKD